MQDCGYYWPPTEHYNEANRARRLHDKLLRVRCWRFVCFYSLLVLSVVQAFQEILFEMAEQVANATGGVTMTLREQMRHASLRAAEARANSVDANRRVYGHSSILPRRSELFGSDLGNFVRNPFGSRGRRENIRLEPETLAAVEAQTIDVAIPLINQQQIEEEPVFDMRLSRQERTRTTNMTSCYVGAVEVTLEGMVAPGADTVVGGVLYDARHSRIDNSLRMAFAASVALDPYRILVYPDHIVSLINGPERVNTSLRLSLICPNFDGREGDIVAHAQVGTVSQMTRHNQDSVHTARLVRGARRDRMQALTYVNENRVAILGRTVPPPMQGRVEVPMQRSYSMRQIGLNEWSPVDAPRHSVVLNYGDSAQPQIREFQPSEPTNPDVVFEARAQAKLACVEQELVAGPKIDQLGPMALMSGSFTIPTTVTKGTVVHIVHMKDIAGGASVYNRVLRALGHFRGSLKLQSVCTISKLTGLALLITHVDTTFAKSVKLLTTQRLMAAGSHVWAPNGERDILEWWFKPFQCSESINFNMLGQSGGSLLFTVLYPWSSDAAVDATCRYTIYADSDVVLTPNILNVGRGIIPTWNSGLDTISFAQGASVKAWRCMIDPGWPTQYKDYRSYSGPQAVLAYYKYVSMDVRIVLRRLSSPFVAATIAVAILPHDVGWSLAIGELETYPHNKFQVDGNAGTYALRIPRERFMEMLSTERKTLKRGATLCNATLAVWVVDSVNGNSPEPLVFSVEMENASTIECCGTQPGYTLDVARAQFENFHQWQDVATLNDWTGISASPIVLNLSTVEVAPMTRMNSALVNILLATVWHKGLLEWRLVWFQDDATEMGKRKGHTTMSVHKGGDVAYAYARFSDSRPSGSIEFFQEIVGPCNGFLNHRSPYEEQCLDTVILDFSERKEIKGFVLQAKVISLEVCGSAMPTVQGIKGVNVTWAEA